ncbi:hypothetical protein GCM10009551_070950 [Nocardiopsis tropica]
MLGLLRHHIDHGVHIAAGNRRLRHPATVDDEVVDTVGPRRETGVHALGGDRLELDDGGRRAEHQPHARGLHLRGGEPLVGDPAARGGRKPVRQKAPCRVLQVEVAAQQAAVDRGGDQCVIGGHGDPLGGYENAPDLVRDPGRLGLQ